MKCQKLQFYNYHLWANQRIFSHLKGLPQDIYHKEIKNVFASISEVLGHIYATDTIWLSVMSGYKFDEIVKSGKQLRENTKDKSIEEMEVMFLKLSERFKAFFEHQDNLDQVVFCEHPNFGQLETTLFELIQHVVNHGTYHRGNITAMLRQMGHPGVMTDYVAYLYAMRINNS
ncbi:DinB family protein [Priestia aryabhattai]|uniref:DinB family protein n=1 Tax=Priestia megaterium TaxID=1404 RepID=UPI0039B967AB